MSKQYPAHPSYPFSFHAGCVSVKVIQSKQITLKKGLSKS